MKAPLLFLSLLVPLTASCAESPKLTEAQKDLLITNMTETVNVSAQANFHTACLTVTRDVKRKHITIFALHAAARSEVHGVEGYEIETVYHPDLADFRFKPTAGTFFEHNNHLVLSFAASEYAAGRKVLAMELVKQLAKVHPEIIWYSHEDHGSLPIAKILSGLQSGGSDLKDFLKEQTDDWKWKAEKYGPKGYQNRFTK